MQCPFAYNRARDLVRSPVRKLLNRPASSPDSPPWPILARRSVDEVYAHALASGMKSVADRGCARAADEAATREPHALWQDLHGSAEGQSQPGLCRPESR